ncbi:MAG: hypothetical protein J4G15_08770 [Alphaproteobacteria bacterium]|nr:hypothetical protein [Alphaproteobacteria bacterium]
MAEKGAWPLARRNIIGLSAILILAGLAGVNPGDLTLFGLDLDAGGRGAIVAVVGAGAAQIYWYFMKYCHMRDDAKANSSLPDRPDYLLRLAANPDVNLKQASANWISNTIAFGLTLGSWWFMYCWIAAALLPGEAPSIHPHDRHQRRDPEATGGRVRPSRSDGG